ncbi:MAG: carbohydrate ABC transporter permease, partial [Clostridia bacterium]|nr:carbohydrate ABC transporter permease [Clostridia bacterium]
MSKVRSTHRRKSSPSRIAFVVFNTVVMIAFSAVCLAPFINLLAISLSDSLPAVSGQVGFFPLNSEGKLGINLDAYKYLVQKSDFFKAFGISVARVVLGVLISVTVQMLAAYPMARGDQFKGRKFFVVFYTVTMFFSGGLIPTYLVITGLGLYDNILALILPTAANAWNMVLFINFFKQIPKD